MNRGRPLRRTPLKRGSSTLKRTRLRPRSDRAAEQAVERKRNLREVFGCWPDCEAYFAGVPVCRPYVHAAHDGHEPGKRSQGANSTDPTQVIPVCRIAHDWIHDHPAEANRLRARDGRLLLILGYADGARSSGTGRD